MRVFLGERMGAESRTGRGGRDMVHMLARPARLAVDEEE